MEKKIAAWIRQYVKRYPTIKEITARWKEPLIAYADAGDPRFLRLKEIISPSHALPADLLGDAKSVITYFLPFDENITRGNIADREASKEWAVTYIETNQLILDLNRHISRELAQLGYETAIIPATHNFDEKKLISDWSHRHVAQIAGLGNFGLNNMLITEKGCSGRIGSMVTNLALEPGLGGDREYCLFKYNGSCKKCVERCVNNALFADSYDRWKCYEMLLHNDSIYPDIGVADVCGKCLVAVPCASSDPVKKLQTRG
jgi:epoxyqueuosine reductase QueG